MKELTGTVLLLRAHLHSGWRGLLSWVVLMAGLVVLTAWSIGELYPTAANRASYAAYAGTSPAVAAFNGRPYDLTTLGGIVSYEIGFMGLVGLPIIALHLAVRFTRHEEDAGRTELVTSARVGRLAPLAAGGLMMLLAMVGFAVISGVGLVVTGLPDGRAWLYAGGLGLLGVAFGAVGLLAAEITRESRMAYSIGLQVILVTFLVRAVVDGRDWPVPWVSPSGWLAEARPWGDPVWWPYAAYLALTACCGLLAAAMATHRDLYGGLVATRPGPAHASRALGTPVGLAWRFTRVPFLGWLLGTVLWSAAIGALSGEMVDLLKENPALTQVLGLDKPEYVVTSMALLICGVGAAAVGVQAMARIAGEESAGRIGLVLSTRAPRWRVWLVWAAVVVLEAVAVLMVSALALGLSTGWSAGDASDLGSALRAGAILIVPVVLVVALCAAIHAFVPRWTALGWALVGWVTIVGMLAETLRIPEWARDLSPLHATGNLPIEDAHTGALLVMASASVLLLVAGLARFRRRELVAG